MQWLAGNGADVTAQNNKAFIDAAENGHLQVVQCPDDELKVILLPVHIKGVPGSHHLKRTSHVTNYLGSYRTSVRELCKRAQTATQGPYHHTKNNCRNFCSHFMDEMWDLRLEDEDLSDEPLG